MGEAELKAALEREARAEMALFWRDAEERLARLREERAQSARTEEVDLQVRIDREVGRRRERMLAEVQRELRVEMLKGTEAFAARLYACAAGALSGFADQHAADLLGALVQELPDRPWERIRCRAADIPLVRCYFPEAAIDADDAPFGGVIAESADGRIRIDNSLRGRLARLWPRLLPQVIADFEKGGEDAAP